ncbi:TRADD-N-associated membrane domain-containing protein [Streptomyces sp. 8L]|uniref:TRADD-N-associated membrane domain-containing protein n=1 Tax=Streptomyces sp. 8L TaxID=2877242 RepID=UPI001CD6E728|nr:hypothetical protein [Streptomyces sp. 8L]MCA1224044.1 hypothetical protein [Streptomyces sp. 8L]
MADESTEGRRRLSASRFYGWIFRRVVPTLAAVFAVFMGLGFALSKIKEDSAAYIWITFTGLILMVIVAYLMWRVTNQIRAREAASRQRVRDAERNFEDALRARRISPQVDPGEQLVQSAEPRGQAEPVQGLRAGDLALPELWAVTHTRLDHYHEIALGQARRSFRNAQVAMALGFSLLVGFVLVALNASTTAGAVVAGGLGAVSAALAGYVSRTFVLSQQTAASHLRAYFDQPLEFSRYLAAERIVKEIDLDQAQRIEVLTTLAQSIVTYPRETASDQGQPSTRA